MSDIRNAGTVILFVIYFGAMAWIGVSIIHIWFSQRERDEVGRPGSLAEQMEKGIVADVIETGLGSK